MTSSIFSSETLTIGTDIPATLTTPDPTGPHPAVLLLHGTASHRDEVGGMYARMAEALAVRGIASLRIDFAGCGASTRPQTAFTVTSQITDARTAYQWLTEQPRTDPGKVAVLGFSQGGMIAALLAGSPAGVAALATWSSGIVPSAFDFLAPMFADGGDHANVDMGFVRFTFSRTWWQEITDLDLATAVRCFHAPLLAVAGSADTQVPPSASLALVSAAASPDKTFVQAPGADHIFNTLDPATDQSDAVIQATADWFTARLTATAAGPTLPTVECAR